MLRIAPCLRDAKHWDGKYRYLKYMFSGELIGLLGQVISSWQVIAVSVALILYMFLVSYVARTYKRPSGPSLIRRVKKDAPPPVGEPDLETSDSDDLGLVEEQN
jgi:hypothetical protein